jgi:hypothetical protein
LEIVLYSIHRLPEIESDTDHLDYFILTSQLAYNLNGGMMTTESMLSKVWGVANKSVGIAFAYTTLDTLRALLGDAVWNAAKNPAEISPTSELVLAIVVGGAVTNSVQAVILAVDLQARVLPQLQKEGYTPSQQRAFVLEMLMIVGYFMPVATAVVGASITGTGVERVLNAEGIGLGIHAATHIAARVGAPAVSWLWKQSADLLAEPATKCLVGLKSALCPPASRNEYAPIA